MESITPTRSLFGKSKRSLVGAGGHHHVARAQMNQPFRCARMGIALQNSQQIAFVQPEAIAVLQNPDVRARLAAGQ